VRRLLACLAVVAALAGAAVAAAQPRAAKGDARTAMCTVSRPPGTGVRCASAQISGVDARWGRTIHTYRGGGSGKRQQRTSWLRRAGRTSEKWTLRVAYVTPPGPVLPPCGKVPLNVLRDFYGSRACTR
jgi:hypothetical protein